ncbi:Type II/IV secretion system protein TadC,associated with Flp pilus assembly [Yersinia frederiksenii]|uniref:Type II/IV secretion system protein TadC,associated with Flp pilus assembly n=2 Tax=Yersinia frederiksenii TaxID=29484 RepID=A0A380PUU4_YERFR|nr:type II secretion system F family protein [Yersinia frederiksenii]ATM94444.1 secretion system protein [Yersinia frederiksenii]EEQ13300.1 Flp pilus assembly protein TadC [Yersinia frederiksenii ATCC 33641]KGA48872.1 type II secretion system (T2SS), F family protein [Yersinia frederiksenii ATCC 33641]SUP77059.1 Type II/IV secretion system protein TadC,associated with Flp pilus assembly [Yersinia frederiksenii]
MIMSFSIIMLLGLGLVIFQIIKNQRLTRARNKIVISSLESSENITENYTKVSTRTESIIASGNRFLFLVRIFDEKGLGKFLFSLFLISMVMMADELLKLDLSSKDLMISCLIIIIAVIIIPGIVRKYIVNARIEKIERDMPLFVDLLAICVQSGLTIESSLKFLAENVGDINDNFVPFLDRLVKKIEVNGLEAGLTHLQKELPSREVSMLCVTLQQSLRYGSSIYEYLMELSSEMRELQLLKTEEIIGKLSAKMSIPLVLFFMFPVVIIIAAPGIMRVMSQG